MKQSFTLWSFSESDLSPCDASTNMETCDDSVIVIEDLSSVETTDVSTIVLSSSESSDDDVSVVSVHSKNSQSSVEDVKVTYAYIPLGDPNKEPADDMKCKNKNAPRFKAGKGKKRKKKNKNKLNMSKQIATIGKANLKRTVKFRSGNLQVNTVSSSVIPKKSTPPNAKKPKSATNKPAVSTQTSTNGPLLASTSIIGAPLLASRPSNPNPNPYPHRNTMPIVPILQRPQVCLSQLQVLQNSHIFTNSMLQNQADSNILTRMATLKPFQNAQPLPTFQSFVFGTNNRRQQPAQGARLRPIAIDGSNVAYAHGQNVKYSCLGIKICIDFFLKRGHTAVKAFVPQFRRKKAADVTDQHILEELSRGKQYIVFTPSRDIGNRRIACYDDRFVIDYAIETNGVIVSNDNYRDLMGENAAYRNVVENRLLMYTFADNLFMVPKDPLGRHSPTLDEFLRFPS